MREEGYTSDATLSGDAVNTLRRLQRVTKGTCKKNKKTIVFVSGAAGKTADTCQSPTRHDNKKNDIKIEERKKKRTRRRNNHKPFTQFLFEVGSWYH